MVLLSMRKWLLSATTAYLMLAAIGTFALTPFGASTVDAPGGKGPAQGVFLTAVDHFMGTLASVEAKENRFSPLRPCLPRTIMPPGLLTAGSGLKCSAVRPITKTPVKADKNNILLKLRI
jgi:hypothetical protein